MSKRSVLGIGLLGVALLLTAGCGGRDNEVDTTPPAPAPAPPPAVKAEPEVKQVEDPGFRDTPPEVKPTRDEIIVELQGRINTIYFDYDRSELSDNARNTLRANASVLNEHPQINVVVEGHCDERGTIEYNLALGERRAAAVRDYLASLGVQRGRMRIKSFGEEKPTAYEHNERAWAQNRRAEFELN